jgi:hypothetical protein
MSDRLHRSGLHPTFRIDSRCFADDPPLCTIPIFSPGASATENTVIGYNDDIIVVNNAGFRGPLHPDGTLYLGALRGVVMMRDAE